MKNLEGLFQGWKIDEIEGVIFDSEGNHYYLDEIRSIFYIRQWKQGHYGTQYEISSLKQQLKDKLEKVKTPTVTIDWGDVQEQYVHPFYRK